MGVCMREGTAAEQSAVPLQRTHPKRLTVGAAQLFDRRQALLMTFW
jgi:hypothetical protein